jgi:uncharacterized protein YutE (UPF0331/DUF86 family)/predicted nucleotidyltransferase
MNNAMPILNRNAIIQTLQASVPDLLAIYAFGSRIQGTAERESDLDLAVLVAGYAEPLTLWKLAGELADLSGCPVDLLDMRAASTVMQHQIITRGECWWAKDAQASLFESAMLSEKTELDTSRAALLNDIQKEGEFMADDVLITRAATLKRGVARAREEYERDPATFATDYTRQDAAILNIQRACEATLDMGQHLIRREKLGVPQSARDVFALLAQGGWITATLAESLKHMVGFRNIAVHDYQTLQLPITVSIIQNNLDEFLQYSQTLLLHDADKYTN